MSINREMDKEDMVHIHNGILLSHKKENAIWNHMDGPRDNQTKWSKSEKERRMPYDVTCMCNLNYGSNEHTYNTKIDSQT